MNTQFQVEVLDFSVLEELDGVWTASDFKALLDAMEFGDQSEISDDELRDMCLMSMQDLGPEEAAYIVLKHVIGADLRDGQLRNIANEMPEEKLWEEYAEPAFHERLFNVGSLLYAAMPGSFPETDAVRAKLAVTAGDAGSAALLTAAPDESFLVRLLADGMDSSAVLHRLYGEQLAGNSFPEAAQVVWTVQAEPADGGGLILEVIGSGYWLDPLRGTKAYQSGAYADTTNAVKRKD